MLVVIEIDVQVLYRSAFVGRGGGIGGDTREIDRIYNTDATVMSYPNFSASVRPDYVNQWRTAN